MVRGPLLSTRNSAQTGKKATKKPLITPGFKAGKSFGFGNELCGRASLLWRRAWLKSFSVLEIGLVEELLFFEDEFS